MIFPDCDDDDLFAELAELRRMFMRAAEVRLVERKEIVGYLPFTPALPIVERRYELAREASFTEGDSNDLMRASSEVWCEGFFVNRHGSFTEGDTNDLSRSG